MSVLAGVLVAAGQPSAAGPGGSWPARPGPIERSRARLLPPYVRDAMALRRAAAGAGHRPDPRHGVGYSVLRPSGRRPAWATPTAVSPSAGRARPATTSPTPSPGWSPAPPTPTSPRGSADSASATSGSAAPTTRNAPGSATPRASAPPAAASAAVVWQLDPAVARASVVPADPASTDPVVPVTRAPAAVPPGTGERHLLIGEAADPRWQAELGGTRLARVVDGWQQGFVLPATGGTVVWSLRSPASWFLPFQGLALLVALVLAAPGIRRPDVRDPVLSARRAATLSEVGSRPAPYAAPSRSSPCSSRSGWSSPRPPSSVPSSRTRARSSPPSPARPTRSAPSAPSGRGERLAERRSHRDGAAVDHRAEHGTHPRADRRPHHDTRRGPAGDAGCGAHPDARRVEHAPAQAPAAPGGTPARAPRRRRRRALGRPHPPPGAGPPRRRADARASPPPRRPRPLRPPSRRCPARRRRPLTGSVVAVASGPTDTGTDDPTGRVTLGLLGQDQTGATVDRQGRGATLAARPHPCCCRPTARSRPPRSGPC